MTSKIGKILVVDDNLGIRRALEILLPLHFAEVKTIPSPSTLVSTLEQFRPDVVLLDMNFYTSINTGNEGLYWAGELKKMVPEVEVVLFTAYADIALAVEGMKRGAFDFIVKPWDNDKLIEVLTAARDKARKALKRDSHSSFDQKTDNPMFWGSSRSMVAIRKTLDKIAPTDATVLITGENGTGKDVLAREIHAHSLRSEKPMVAVDAGAISETLFESELFGHVKGAFTDAHTDHMGKFEQADGGTLFLERFARKYHRSLTGLSVDAADALKEYRWSGNIRELQNCIEKAVILSDGTTLTEKDLQLERSGKPAVTTIRAVSEFEEERLIRDAMEQTGGNISAAAKKLGVSRPTLYAKLKKYGL